MSRRAVPFLFTLACLATTPIIARAQQATTPPPAAPAPAPARAAALPGPRVQPEYPRYEPALAGDHASVTTAAAADRTVITISTLGLVLLIVLLVILIA